MKSTTLLSVAEYQPTARRPIAQVFRRTARGATRLCLRLGISADLISYSSVIFAAAAAGCFWRSSAHPLLLIVAPLFCYLRLWCNMLDGMVALAAGAASRRGELVNELPDRVSDAAISMLRPASASFRGFLRKRLSAVPADRAMSPFTRT